MTEVCAHCGVALAKSAAFCIACGARTSDASATSSPGRFCTKCGTPLGGEVKFCSKCGAPGDGAARTLSTASASAPVAAAVPPSTTATTSRDAAPQPSAAPVPASATPAVPSQTALALRRTSSGIPKIAIGVVAILLIFVVAGIPGITYVVHHVHQKVVQVEAQSDAERNPAGSQPAKSAAANRTNQTPVEELKKRLWDLQRAAPDNNTSATLDNLSKKLNELDLAVRRDPNDQKAKEDLKKGLDDISAAATGMTPSLLAATDAALTPPPISTPPPLTPVAATGDPKHDWPLEYERTVGGPEADLVVRTGDINNLGFGWPSDFDPFSGNSTPPHLWPTLHEIPPQSPPGTDRVILGTGVTPVQMSIHQIEGKLDRVMIDSVTRTIPGDGYSTALEACYSIASLPDNILRYQTANHIQLPPNYDDAILSVSTRAAVQCTHERQVTMPTPIVLNMGELPSKIDSVIVQIFVDDFQAPLYHSYFQVSLNGMRIPSFEYVINSLDQSGPIGKLVTMKLLPEYWPLLQSGTVKLLIDDPTTHARDGYAIDFVRILVNPHRFNYQVSLTATVTDADKHTPIPGALVNVGPISAATDRQGKSELKGIPAGLAVATANADGYDQNSVPVDLPAGHSGHADIQLHAHQESTADLEKSIAQTGIAEIYGIHFDTDSSKLRADSMPALNAVLGLINGRSGSKWIIAGHTDNQGSDALNIPLSKARAASVISWLTAHGISSDRLEPQGFGSTRPVVDNATGNGRALNRRVEVSLAK